MTSDGWNTESRKALTNRVELCKDLINYADPVTALKLVMERGGYQWNCVWDVYKDGIMITSELSYFLHGASQVIDKTTLWSRSSSVQEAKRTVCERHLRSMGVWSERAAPTAKPERDVASIAAAITKLVTGGGDSNITFIDADGQVDAVHLSSQICKLLME